MTELHSKIIMNMVGNVAQQSERNARALGRFARSGVQDLTRLQRAVRSVDGALSAIGNRYTGIVTGGTGALAVNHVVNLGEQLARLGNKAGYSNQQMAALRKEILDLAQRDGIRIEPEKLTEAIDAILSKTGDMEYARNTMQALALTIGATGAEGDAVGGTVAQLKKLKIAADDAAPAMALLYEQGNMGSFELSDMAALGERIFSAYASFGRTGMPAVRELGAAMQMIRGGTGGPEQAATAFESMMATFTDAKKLKLLQEGGVQVYDPAELRSGREVIRPIPDLMMDIVKATEGRKTMLGQVFGAEAIRAFNQLAADYRGPNGMDDFKKIYGVSSDARSIEQAAARVANTAAGALRNLTTAAEELAERWLSEPVQKAADVANQAGRDQVQDWGDIAVTGFAALGGGVVAQKVASKLFGKGLGELGLKAGAGIASGAQHAAARFVTSPALMTGAAWLGHAAAPLAAGAAGYGLGSLLNKTLVEGTDFSDQLGRAIARALSAVGNDDARAALASDRASRVDMRLSVDVKNGRATIEALDADRGVNVELDTGVMGGYH